MWGARRVSAEFDIVDMVYVPFPLPDLYASISPLMQELHSSPLRYWMDMPYTYGTECGVSYKLLAMTEVVVRDQQILP